MKIQLIIYTIFYLLLCDMIPHADAQISEFQDFELVDKDGTRIIKAINTEDKISVDGKFKEKCWKNAVFQGHFIQREPVEGEPATEETQVAVLQHVENLYIGVKCFDVQPKEIIAREMRRDGDLDEDDFFRVVIDTYHDHRNDST